MRGRITVAVLALVAFCASFGVPLQPLFARPMTCCPSGKAASCCKRQHGAGWVGNASPCGSSCACAFPPSGAPAVAGSTSSIGELAQTTIADRLPDSPDTLLFHQPFLFQRPPPTRS